MTPSLIALLAVLGLGLLVTLVGNLMLLVAAFRESVLWGLACLLLPFAQLVFIVRNWQASKAGFYTGLAGCAVMVAALFSVPQGRAALLQSADLPFLSASAKPKLDLNAEILEQRGRIEELEGAFAQNGAALAQQFQALSAQRTGLKPGDEAAITQFNAAAAAYQAKNEQHKQTQLELATAREELEKRLAQRAKATAANPAATTAPHPITKLGASPAAVSGGGKRVVIYTTAVCPACIKAKQYFAQKGVSYQEIDVNKDTAGREAFQKLGGRGVPLILIGDKRLEGFSAQALDAAL